MSDNVNGNVDPNVDVESDLDITQDQELEAEAQTETEPATEEPEGSEPIEGDPEPDETDPEKKLIEQRLRDKDAYITRLQQENQAEREARLRSDQELARQQQTQTPVDSFYTSPAPQTQQPVDPEAIRRQVEYEMYAKSAMSTINNSLGSFVKNNPDLDPNTNPERYSKFLDTLKPCINLTNVTQADLQNLPNTMKKAYDIAFYDENKLKANANKKLNRENNRVAGVTTRGNTPPPVASRSDIASDFSDANGNPIKRVDSSGLTLDKVRRMFS